MLVLLMSMVSFAWDFEPVQLSAAGADDVDVTADRAAWLAGGVAYVSDHAGRQVWSGSSDASQLVLVDYNADGVTDILALCGPSGLSQVVLGDSSIDVLDTAACTGIAERSGSIVVQADELAYWSSRGGPSLDGSESIGPGVAGGDLIAYTTDPPGLLKPSLAVARSGTEQVLVYIQQDPPLTVDTKSPIRSLGAGDTWIWVSTAAATSTIIQDGALADARMPANVVLSQADFSGDGALDLVGGSSGGLYAETQRWVALHRDDSDIEHVSALRDGECSTAIMAGAGGVHLMQAIDCGEDSDGDGLTSELGDCHDGDPAINPDAFETCDGVDENCDGRIDDVGVSVEGELQADEGQVSNTLLLSPSCVGGTVYGVGTRVADGDENLRCDTWPGASASDPVELSCEAGDDGDFVVELLLGGETPTRVPLSVRNVAPRLPDGQTEISVSTAGGSLIPIEDYDDDVIVEVLDGPRWFEVDSDRRIVNPAPRERRWNATLRLDDRDGGVTEVDVELVGREPSTSCVESNCSTAGPSGIWPFSLVLLAFARRRREG